MSAAEQMAALYRRTDENTASIHTRFDSLDVNSKNRKNRVNELEAKVATIRGEVEQLKDLRVRGQPTCQLKVTGIPNNCTLPLDDIAERVFKTLKLHRLLSDILETRPFAPRSMSNSTGNSQTDATKKGSSSMFIIRMKSAELCNFVLEKKRKFGQLKVSAIGLGKNNNNVVNIFEMLPQPIHELRLPTKSKKVELGHRFTWARNGNVFVRKEDGQDDKYRANLTKIKCFPLPIKFVRVRILLILKAKLTEFLKQTDTYTD